MIYLISVNHHVQYLNAYSSKKKHELVKIFINHLREAIRTVHAVLIAEEFNEEAIHRNNASSSTAQNVAQELGIEHRFCDPDSAERTKHGIKDKMDPRREQLWLECIRRDHVSPIIFICGISHLERFRNLLQQNGFDVTVYSQDWGKGFEDPW